MIPWFILDEVTPATRLCGYSVRLSEGSVVITIRLDELRIHHPHDLTQNEHRLGICNRCMDNIPTKRATLQRCAADISWLQRNSPVLG